MLGKRGKQVHRCRDGTLRVCLFPADITFFACPPPYPRPLSPLFLFFLLFPGSLYAALSPPRLPSEAPPLSFALPTSSNRLQNATPMPSLNATRWHSTRPRLFLSYFLCSLSCQLTTLKSPPLPLPPPASSSATTRCRPTNLSARSKSWPRSSARTARFPTGSACAPTTKLGTMPSADSGAAPSSASKSHLDCPATSFFFLRGLRLIVSCVIRMRLTFFSKRRCGREGAIECCCDLLLVFRLFFRRAEGNIWSLVKNKEGELCSVAGKNVLLGIRK